MFVLRFFLFFIFYFYLNTLNYFKPHVFGYDTNKFELQLYGKHYAQPAANTFKLQARYTTHAHTHMRTRSTARRCSRLPQTTLNILAFCIRSFSMQTRTRIPHARVHIYIGLYLVYTSLAS